MPLDTTTDVETPEHVRFRYRTVGPVRRLLAYLVDIVLRGAITLVVALLLALSGVSADEKHLASFGLVLLALFLLEWCYHVLFEALWDGRTPGKRLLRLRVVKEGGYPITFVDALLRNLLRAADFLPVLYAVGALVMAGDERFRRLGDLVAGTMVIADERRAAARPLLLDPPPTAAELAALPSRVPLSSDELEAVELLLRRRAMLSPEREEELAQMIAPLFVTRLGVEAAELAPARLLALLHHKATVR